MSGLGAAKRVLTASRRVLLQKEALLCGMEEAGLARLYAAPCKVTGGTIGSHVRHSLAHYDTLVGALLAQREPKLDYDTRVRGSAVETDLSAGLEAILECSETMGRLDLDWLAKPVAVEFLLDGSESSRQAFTTNAMRELWFVAHHSLHHQAMIKVIANCLPDQADRQAMSEVMPRNFGRAPSTIAHAASEPCEG